MNIKGGALEFDIIANNGQINSALAETKRRVQGFTDATVEGGDRMEAAYREAAAQIEAAFKDIDTMAAIHSNAIADLEKEYARLGEAAGAAFMKGTAKGDEEYRALTAKQQAIKDEIAQRKALLQEVANTADALQKEEQTLNENKAKVEQNAKAKGMLRTQVMNLKNSLAEMEQNGKRNTDEYRAMQAELGRLADAMADANTQAKIMSDDYQNMNTVLEVMGGISGAFSAAQGAVGLFAGENENLQKIMVKVQSLMAITIGLQQVAKTLNKDSYTQLVLVRKAKELLTVAETKFATALGISNVAAKALMATLTLGLSVAITAVITLVSKYISKTREAKKAQEEFNSKVVEAAINPVASILELSATYNRLGDNIKAKEKFIEDNRDKFEDLGVSVKSVAEAEKLLIDNKEKFIEAQMFKAKALAATETATEKYKEALQKELELENTPEKLTQTVQRVREGGYGRPATFYNETIQVDNPEYKKLSEQKETLEREGAELFAMAHEFTAEEQKILTEIGASANKITEGSIAALEKTISTLKTKYKEAATDTERTALLKQIQEQEALLKKIDLTATDTGGDKEKDPFTEKLEQRKKKYQEYANWLNSTNEDIRNSAKTEFAGLLAEGESYEAYLKNLKRELEALPETADRNKKISVVSNELVSIEKDTYMDGYTKSLEKQISLADTLVEKLAIIADKRKELETDDSGLTKEKGAVLDTEQVNIAKQAQEDYTAAMRDYNDYLQSKIDAELSYQTRRSELEVAIAKETDAERKKILETQLKTLDTTQQLKQTMDYDALVEEYKTYQQKCADISAQYDEKIALATEQKNEELVAKLQEAKNKALSSAALQELQDSGAWEQLFGNLDDLTTAQIQALIDKIEAQKAQLGVELDPQDLDVVLSKLREAKDEIQTRNPFKALSTALKDYKKDASKANLSEVFKSVGATADLVKGSFDAVTGALSNMGLAGDEVTQKLLGDIGEMVGSAGQLATGIATGNPLGIIQGSIGLISSAFEVFNFRDRRAERAIKKHAAAVEELERTYKALEYAVDNALGESEYDNQKALINNMREQQAHLQAMWEAEEGKKKTDSGKVNEYKEQYAELGRQIQTTIAEITESITQTSAKDLATQLSDAIAEAYADGFSSDKVSSAINKVTNQVLGNAVKNALKKQLLETQLESAVKQLQRDMGFDEEGGGSFDGLTPEEQQRFKDRVNSIAQGYAEALKLYEDLFKDLDDTGDPTTSLSGAIKGASQESIDLLAGQTNAVRVNQVQQIEVLRQQLIHLANIDGKLSVSNRYLEQIEKNTSGSASDPLRAQGITM